MNVVAQFDFLAEFHAHVLKQRGHAAQILFRVEIRAVFAACRRAQEGLFAAVAAQLDADILIALLQEGG